MRPAWNTARRWWRYPMLRSYEWQLSPRFWRFGHAIKVFRFRFRKLGFKAKSLVRDSTATSSILRQILQIIFWRVVFAIGLVALLMFLERHISLPFIKLSDAGQSAFLTTMGQVSAAFLGLYFTAISIVASTAYARVPGDIRALVVQEEVGSFYFSTLAQFAGVSTVLLTALSFNLPVGSFNTLFLSLLCLFAVFSFVVLGLRAFSFFDPAALVEHINRHLSRSILSVTPDGYKWTDESFQAHHQKQAEEFLNSYSNLIIVASQKENLHGKALVQIAEGLFYALSFYSVVKAKIPSTSFWFKRRHSHKDWLLASHHEIQIALATGTSIFPESVPDLMWFENKIAPLIGEIVGHLNERKDLSGTLSLASGFQRAMRVLGESLSVREGLQMLKPILPKLRVAAGIEKPFSLQDERSAERMAIVELYCCGFINLIIGYSSRSEELSSPMLEKLLSNTDWRRAETLYRTERLPRKLVEELEFLESCLDFESRVEGQIVSPKWLIQEMAARGLARFLDDSAKPLLDQFELLFAKEMEAQLTAKNYVVVAQLLQRGLEASDKLANCFNRLSQLHEAYAAFNRSKEYEWPAIDCEGFQQRIAASRRQMIVGLATAANHLASVPEDVWPDFFGQAYSILANQCLTAMLAGDDELFRNVFPPYFAAALQASERLRQKLGAANVQKIELIGEPLVDLLEISGYSAVLSELDGKGFWKLVMTCWDSYFSQITDKNQAEGIIKFFVALSMPTGRVTQRAVLRTEWQQRVEYLLRQRGILRDRGEYYDRESVPRHASSLVRVFAGGSRIFTEPHDVFFALYLFKRAEAAAVEKPRSTEHFEQSLKRAGEKKSSQTDDEE